MDPNDVDEACEPATIEGLKYEWRVDPSLLGQPFSERIGQPFSERKLSVLGASHMRVGARPFLQGVSERHKVQRTHVRALKLAQNFRHELVTIYTGVLSLANSSQSGIPDLRRILRRELSTLAFASGVMWW